MGDGQRTFSACGGWVATRLTASTFVGITRLPARTRFKLSSPLDRLMACRESGAGSPSGIVRHRRRDRNAARRVRRRRSNRPGNSQAHRTVASQVQIWREALRAHRRGRHGMAMSKLSGTTDRWGRGPATVKFILASGQSVMSHMLVIGAGITGVTTAYTLAKQGYRVTVLDRHHYPAMELRSPTAASFPRATRRSGTTPARCSRA